MTKFTQDRLLSLTLTAALFGAAACGPQSEDPDQNNDGGVTQTTDTSNTSNTSTTPPDTANNHAQPTPPEGQTTFHSADARNGQRTQENTGNNAAEPGAADEFDSDGAADDRTVEEGDIYQVVSGQSNLILNLNAYRGFQIIDFSDVSNPKIIGKVQVTGQPVEMYQVGDRVYILLNDWYSYWRSSRYDSSPERHHGGGVIVVDISNTAAPTITSQSHLDGWIRTSRLTRGGGKEALYVVSNEYNGGGQTNVTSYSVSTQGKLQQKTALSLGGYVQDIQATPERLIVSRYNYQSSQGRSELSLIDITSPEGEMIEGDSIFVKGQVRNKFNMNIHEDVLRVVSGNNWNSSTNTNHVQTFDASDIHNLTPIDSATFGDNEDLYATLFMEEKAFFVTYRRVDPFHAFEVKLDGTITEKSEFIVSGWNDFFKPVSSKTRLIGIGKNDEDGKNTMAVSLYDITDLTNASPLIDRAEVELDRSWSEAQWDDRAFSVLEKATNIPSPDGSATETGLVLLPFSGWNEVEKRYISAVQIYTFSSDTLTLRGTMEHGSRVRRSFLADRNAATTANLSEAELSLFDTSNPDAPQEKGRVELAPNYSNVKIFGDHAVRHHNRSDYYGWWGSYGQSLQTDSLQIVALGGDVDGDEPVATLDVPANTKTYKLGEHLVALSSVYEPGPNNDYSKGKYVTDLEVWDLSSPAQPQLAGTLQTDRIQGQGGYYGGWEDCWDCGYYGGYGYTPEPTVVGDSLVFPRHIQQKELLGSVHYTYTRPASQSQRYSQDCYDRSSGTYAPKACTYHTGGITCSTLTRVDGTVESEVCSGSLLTCVQDNQGETECEEVLASAIPTQTSEREREQYRYWTSYELDVLDLSDATSPVMAPLITLPVEEAAIALVGNESTLHVNYSTPYDVPGDSRPYVRYWTKPIDLSDAAAPVIGQPVNLPGKLLFAQDDTLLTQDYLWGEIVVESSLNKLKLHDGKAYLQGTPHRFVDQQVEQVMLDGAGHALVSHRKAYYANYDENHYDWEDYDRTNRMTMVAVGGEEFEVRSTVEVDDWASLAGAQSGRALYQVPGGLLVMNLDDATKPRAQAYYPTRGWPQDVTVSGEDIYFSAGRYGIYTFGLDEENLYLSED